jgi:hypothetical protein
MQDRSKQSDTFATTLVLPRDELAVRRARKSAGPSAPSALSVQQLHRLLAANELRKKSEQDE